MDSSSAPEVPPFARRPMPAIPHPGEEPPVSDPLPFERLHRDLTHYLRQPAPDGAQADAGRYVLSSPEPAHRLWRE